MSAAKHTAGPWMLSGDRVKCSTGFVAFTACNPREVDESRRDGESWLEMRERTEPRREMLAQEVAANARLIAAAPELLAASQKALAECCDLAETDAGRALEAAVAKATGGQP